MDPICAAIVVPHIQPADSLLGSALAARRGRQMHKGGEDPDLTEVKAVLRKLQRLDEASIDKVEAKRSGIPGLVDAKAQNANNFGVFDKKLAALGARISGSGQGSPRRLLDLARYPMAGLFIAATLVAIVLFGVWRFATHDAAESAITHPRGTVDEAVILADARRLLDNGDVVKTRQLLLASDAEANAKLALMLAQSYDPNYLSSLGKADARPDRGEAERWYRKWYDLAKSAGLEMDSVRLNRIINAMQSN